MSAVLSAFVTVHLISHPETQKPRCGWVMVRTLSEAYQHADDETMLRVVLEAGELREAKGARPKYTPA